MLKPSYEVDEPGKYGISVKVTDPRLRDAASRYNFCKHVAAFGGGRMSAVLSKFAEKEGGSLKVRFAEDIDGVARATKNHEEEEN